MKENNSRGEPKRSMRLLTSILLLLVSLVSLVAATAAWFSISDKAQVRSFNMEVTAGPALRFDLDPHKTFEEYIKTLEFTQIADRILKDQGFDMRKVPLEPVTTEDCEKFTLKNGTVVESKTGKYLAFKLNFMAQKDMVVHLTSEHSQGAADGTAVTSKTKKLPDAMRISFTADGKTKIYDPGMGSKSQGNVFGLGPAGAMEYNESNALFSLKADTNKEVEVRVWLEGTDPECTNELKGADYSIQLRFEGITDEQGPTPGRTGYSGHREEDQSEPEETEEETEVCENSGETLHVNPTKELLWQEIEPPRQK
ncbi:MAG: hypothetical protein Q4B59_00730 [Lachnospiraceae bacterium]|nr:hypothetical protein [Lachnospiraceae bacterium]